MPDIFEIFSQGGALHLHQKYGKFHGFKGNFLMLLIIISRFYLKFTHISLILPQFTLNIAVFTSNMLILGPFYAILHISPNFV